ncbi:MAG: hypothetical protein IT166_06110 [Bryobacterales bacterium]|nr:hypothetical protein [Bryobacterales bacterium]
MNSPFPARFLKTFLPLALGAAFLMLAPGFAMAEHGGRRGGHGGYGRSFSGHRGYYGYSGHRGYYGRSYAGRGYYRGYAAPRGYYRGGGYYPGRFYAGRGYYYGGRFWARPYFGIGIGIPFGYGYYTQYGCGYYDGWGYWRPAPCYVDPIW